MVEFDIHAVDLARFNTARWNCVRWSVGALTAILWILTVFASPKSSAMLRTFYMLGLLATEGFGTLSATLLMKRSEDDLLTRVTDWGAFAASVMLWFIGLATNLWAGMTALEGLILALSVGTAFAWLVLAVISTPRK